MINRKNAKCKDTNYFYDKGLINIAFTFSYESWIKSIMGLDLASIIFLT